MNQIYRILLVEDDLFDAELNIREIRKILPDSVIERVDNETDFIEILESYNPDIIISDFSMPSFDGLSALKIARETHPIVPFIIVTGSVNEDTAVECMKAGATDYVLKDSLKRLGSSVLNALEQTKIRKERIEAFETIKQNEAKYRYMFHNNPQLMWIVDVETLAFLEVNEAAIRHYGYTQEEFLSMTMKDIQLAGEGESLIQVIHSIDDQLNQVGEWTHQKKNGELISVEIVSYPITYNEHVARHVLINDITERKKIEAELIKAKEKAEESDHLKSAFLANMSHEIRTPLNSIIGFSELLGDSYFEQEQKDEFIRTIIDNGNNLLVIISDIMDFSMLESGQMKTRNEVISSKKLIGDLVADYSKKATQKGIEIRMDQLLTDTDARIESDPYRINQILRNLIDNALKFTEEGYIEIGFKIQDDNVEFHVKDTGIGIAPEHHQTIFERFRQVDSARTRKYGGNGLGLAISKNLVKLLGGDIRVESELNKYSDFFFTIPINSKNQEKD